MCIRTGRPTSGKVPIRFGTYNIRNGRNGGLEAALRGVSQEKGIVRTRISILRRQNTVAQFIATRPILDLCNGAVRRPGARVPRRWWEQTGVNLKGAREKSAATEEAAEPALTGLDSESEADTPDGTTSGTGEETSLSASGPRVAEWSQVEPSGAKWSQVERSGAEWSGVERSERVEPSGAKWSQVERSGAEWSGVERSGAEWSGLERSGAE